MAVKYVREGFRDGAKGTHSRMGEGLWRRPMTPKQRLTIIYVGLLAFFILLAAVHVSEIDQNLRPRPMIEGNGVVMKKILGEEGTAQARYQLLVGVPRPQAEKPPQAPTETERSDPSPYFVDHVATDEAGWRLVQEGMPVRVTYQIQRNGSVRVISVSITEEGTGIGPAPADATADGP